jgi:squalene cyclase
VTNAVNWLIKKQLNDGGWTEIVPPPKHVKKAVRINESCTWITGHVIQALVKADVKNVNVKLAVEYLKSCQNADGGWPPWKGGESTLSIMDYVIKALVDYGEPTNSPLIQRAVKYILSLKTAMDTF